MRTIYGAVIVRTIQQTDWRCSMSRLLVILAALSMSVASGQTPKPATQARPGVKQAARATKPFTRPKSPWGDPDLQGVWNDATSTPLQRPTGVKEKDVLSDEEAADFQKDLEFQLSRDRRDGGPDVDVN